MCLPSGGGVGVLWWWFWLWRRSHMFDVTAGDCKNEAWHSATRPSQLGRDCQSSLSMIPALFTQVLLTYGCARVCVCERACVCGHVYPQAIDVGEVTVWRGPLSVALWSGMRVSSPDRHSHTSWPAMATANVGHVLWQSNTAYATCPIQDRTRAVHFDGRRSLLNAWPQQGRLKAAVMSTQLET